MSYLLYNASLGAHQLAVPSMPFCLELYATKSKLGCNSANSSLDYANPIVFSKACLSPLLMQARCCRNSNRSQPSTDAIGVADPARDYKRPFFSLFILVGNSHVSSQLSTDAIGVADSARDYKQLFFFFLFWDRHETRDYKRNFYVQTPV